MLSGFDKLNPYYLETTQVTNGVSIGASLIGDYSNIKASLTAEWTAEERLSLKRALPLQLTPERLAEFLGAANCCWVIEDFHKVPEGEKTKFSQLLKTFMDVATEYPAVRIVAVGAVDAAREVVEYDPEMSNRVTEILVPMMSESEILGIMRKGEEILNLELGAQTRKEIATYSSGLPSVCHQLCLNICRAAGLRTNAPSRLEITQTHLQEAVTRYIADSSDTLKAVWDSATKVHRARRYDNCKLVLGALVRLPADGASHAQILAKIHEIEADYPPGNLTTYARELCTPERSEILRFDAYSNRFSFSNPLYRAYALLRLAPTEQQPGINPELKDLLFKAISEILSDESLNRPSS